jgi:hypothetical protein
MVTGLSYVDNTSRCTHLVELVDRTGHISSLLCGNTGQLKDTVKDLSVVDLDSVLADIQSRQGLAEDTQDLGVRDHGVVVAGNVEILYISGRIVAMEGINQHIGRTLSSFLWTGRADLDGTPCQCGIASCW